MRSITLYSIAALVLLVLSSPASIYNNMHSIDYMTYQSFNFDDLYTHQNSQAVNVATTNTSRIKRAIRYQMNKVDLRESVLSDSDLSIKFSLNKIDENNQYQLILYVEDNINGDIMWNSDTTVTIDNYTREKNLDKKLHAVVDQLFDDFENEYPGFYTVAAR